LSSFENLSENARQTIKKNELEGIEESPSTNEIAERVFRMANEQLTHCKSIEILEKRMIWYFNNPEARLN